MAHDKSKSRTERSRRWAPWWIYLVIIIGANLLRQLLIPLEAMPELAHGAIAIGLAGALFLMITAIYRAMDKPTNG